jgi:hypothetical protein
MVRPCRRPLLRVLLLALAVAAAPLPAFAGDPPTAQANLNLTASVAKAVAKEAVTLKPAPVARAQSSGGTTTDLGSGSFFKSPAGIVALVATAVGVGLVLRSTSKDRVAVDQITKTK